MDGLLLRIDGLDEIRVMLSDAAPPSLSIHPDRWIVLGPARRGVASEELDVDPVADAALTEVAVEDVLRLVRRRRTAIRTGRDTDHDPAAVERGQLALEAR